MLDKKKKFIQALPEDNKMLPAGYLENLHRDIEGQSKAKITVRKLGV